MRYECQGHMLYFPRLQQWLWTNKTFIGSFVCLPIQDIGYQVLTTAAHVESIFQHVLSNQSTKINIHRSSICEWEMLNTLNRAKAKLSVTEQNLLRRCWWWSCIATVFHQTYTISSTISTVFRLPLCESRRFSLQTVWLNHSLLDILKNFDAVHIKISHRFDSGQQYSDNTATGTNNACKLYPLFFTHKT